MNKHFLLQAFGCLMMAGLMGCVADMADDSEIPVEDLIDPGHDDHHVHEGRTEGRPIEDGVVEKSGQLDCTERLDKGYERGQSYSIKVVHIDGKPVEKATARAYYLMRQAAKADGISLRIISGFRTQGEQQYLYGCYVNCNCNNCNLAAYPGYSNHQNGYALDLNTHSYGVYNWLANNAARFGFKRTVPSEDWHWEFLGGGSSGSWPCAGGNSGGGNSGGSNSGGGNSGGGNSGGGNSGGACGSGPKYTVPSGGSCWTASQQLGCAASDLVNCTANRGCSALWAGDVLTCRGSSSDSGSSNSGDSANTCKTYSVPSGGSCWDAAQQLGCSASSVVNCSAPSAGCNDLWAGDVLSCGSGCCP